MKKNITLMIFLLFAYTGSYAQSTYEFLRLDMSPRAAGLGGSFVASSDDPDIIFYNPAGIKLLSNLPVSFSFTKHLMDFNFASLSASKEFENIGRFAAGFKYANYGTFTGADEFANKTGEYGASEVALLLGYSNQIDSNFYYGANAKFIYSGIENYSSTAAAIDLGLLYIIPAHNLSFGLSVLNLGAQLSSYIETKEDLPLDVVAGISYKLRHIPFRMYLDFHRLNEKGDGFSDKFKYFTAGGEFNLSKVLTLRLGYENSKRKDLKIDDFAGLAGFNIGLGITIKSYLFNYAYSSLGQIGAIHRIGLRTEF